MIACYRSPSDDSTLNHNLLKERLGASINQEQGRFLGTRLRWAGVLSPSRLRWASVWVEVQLFGASSERVGVGV